MIDFLAGPNPFTVPLDVEALRADFAFIDHWILVEVDGGTFSGGRHVRGKGYEDDCRKINEATRLGWRVYRFTTEMVKSGEAIALLETELKTERAST